MTRARPAALLAFGTLLALALLEGALRTYDALKPKPPAPRTSLWQQQRGYGWLHPAGLEAPWSDDHGEYSLTVKMNAQGLRDVEHDHAKPPGVFRILLLGDSYMEGVQVPLEDLFARLLEKDLRARGRSVEVINASAADWGTDNELVYLREQGWKYSPDLVLLAFTTANDVRNNSVDLNLRVPNPNVYKPTFTLDPAGKLVERPMPELPPAAGAMPWWTRLRVGIFLANRLGIPLQAAPGGATPDAVAKPLPLLGKGFTDMLVYSTAPLPQVLEAWRVTEALILQMGTEARQHGAGFAVFLVNGPWAHYDDYWDLMTMLERDTEGRDRREPNRRLMTFLERSAIPALDLFDRFESRKSGERLYFREDPHWTAVGHRTAATEVAGFLVEEGLVPTGR